MIDPRLGRNIDKIQSLFTGSGDFVGRKFRAGGKNGPYVYMAYIDLLTDRRLIELSILDGLTQMDIPPAAEKNNGLLEWLLDSGLPTADVRKTDDFDEAVTQVLTGDAVIFADGCDGALILSAKGYPNRGVNSADTEVVVQGPKESFCEAFRINTALMRRRIRDTRMKVKQSRMGERSKTDIALIYLDGVARPKVLEAVEAQLKKINIDGIMDSGALTQLLNDNWRSPFPNAQMTERPDKAAASVLEGRVVIVMDGSPFVLIVPATLNVFFHSSEDYYNHWLVMTALRVLRYAAAFLAVALPGFYMAAAVYHPSMIPLLMAIKMAAARQSVPFPAVIEILMMDAAFELLREAGVRLPGSAGGTIGIVGGLIIGQAAVEAGLVSPIVVIIIALTGIASFAIPNISLVNSLRLVKYLILLLASVLGFYGFWAGLLITLTHLASLRSYGVPYLMPFAAGELNHGSDLKDSIIRAPLSRFTKRPFFARPQTAERQ